MAVDRRRLPYPSPARPPTPTPATTAAAPAWPSSALCGRSDPPQRTHLLSGQRARAQRPIHRPVTQAGHPAYLVDRQPSPSRRRRQRAGSGGIRSSCSTSREATSSARTAARTPISPTSDEASSDELNAAGTATVARPTAPRTARSAPVSVTPACSASCRGSCVGPPMLYPLNTQIANSPKIRAETTIAAPGTCARGTLIGGPTTLMSHPAPKRGPRISSWVNPNGRVRSSARDGTAPHARA